MFFVSDVLAAAAGLDGLRALVEAQAAGLTPRQLTAFTNAVVDFVRASPAPDLGPVATAGLALAAGREAEAGSDPVERVAG